MALRTMLHKKEEVQLQMTSMIDVVFLLLAFFIITYRVPEIEGDFNIKMPAAVQSNQMPSLDEITPVTVHLSADESGRLRSIAFGDKVLGTDFNVLRRVLFEYVQTGTPVKYEEAMAGTVSPQFRNDLEIEFDCDEALCYQYVMSAITAVTGYLNGENQIVKMVEKIKFTPPKTR